jgi:Lon protease-like protein
MIDFEDLEREKQTVEALGWDLYWLSGMNSYEAQLLYNVVALHKEVARLTTQVAHLKAKLDSS